MRLSDRVARTRYTPTRKRYGPLQPSQACLTCRLRKHPDIYEGGSRMPPPAGYDGRSQLCFINANCSSLASVMRNCHIETVELRNQDGGFRAKCRGDVSNALQVVGILNFEHIGEFSAGKINALLRGAETCIIHHSRSRHAGYHFSRIRIEDIELGGLTSSNIQAMIRRIERDRGEAFRSRNRPGRNDRALVAVENFDGAVAPNVDEHAGAGWVESHGFDIIGIHFNLANLFGFCGVDDFQISLRKFCVLSPGNDV